MNLDNIDDTKNRNTSIIYWKEMQDAMFDRQHRLNILGIPLTVPKSDEIISKSVEIIQIYEKCFGTDIVWICKCDTKI